MALKFYLYSIDNQHEIHCDTNSTFTEIAGVFDLGTMLLEWNECKHAIFPNTPFFIVDTETNEKWSFIINQDNVEVVRKTSPVKYLHTLTLSQSIHKINNVPVRNTSFSLPVYSEQKISRMLNFIGAVSYINYDNPTYDGVYNCETGLEVNDTNFLKKNYAVDFRNDVKIKNGTIKISSNINYFKDSSAATVPQVTNLLAKHLNQDLTYIDIWIVNYDDPNDFLRFRYTNETSVNEIIGKEIPLTEQQINWMTNKQFYIRLDFVAVSENVASQIFPQHNDEFLHRTPSYFPLIYGMIKVELNLNIYRDSLWDVLDILNKQCKKQYNGSSYSDFYTMPDKTIGQGLELDSVIAPEFNFNGMDLYECVAKVMSFIDAFPVLDENGVLGFQYLNDLSEDVIEDLEMSDVKTTLNEENFTNRLATTYQEGKINNPIVCPRKDGYKLPATATPGIPGRDDWYFFVNKPIDYIDKLTVIIGSSGFDAPRLRLFEKSGSEIPFDAVYFMYVRASFESESFSDNMEVDLLPCVYSNETYALLQVGSAKTTQARKYNSIYFSRGDNKIYCGITGQIFETQVEGEVLEYAIKRAIFANYGYGTNETPTSNPYLGDLSMNIIYPLKRNTYFNCVYHTTVDGKVSQESISNKAEKETMVAQANSGVELNRLGNNLQGLIAKLGNEEKSVTLPITKLRDRVKLGTHYIDELGNNWIVNRIKTTFTTREDKVICEATFTKNFNAMQQFTSLNQEKRMYEISQKITSKGYENINEFIYFTSNINTNVASLSENIAFNNSGVAAIVDKCFHEDNYKTKNYVLDNVMFTTENNDPDICSYIQPIVYGCGNQICFEMSYEETISAGNYYDSSQGQTIYQAYTKQSGYCKTVSLIGKFADLTRTLIPDYPHLPSNGYDSIPGDWCFGLTLFDYYKKPNEIFHTNYSINFLPYWTKTIDELGTPQYRYEEIFFGDKFINENGIIPNRKSYKQKKFRLYYGNEKYSIIDNKANGNYIDNVEIFVNITSNGGSTTTGYKTYGEIRVGNNAYDVSAYKSWCIADEEGNVYIAVNRDSNSSDYARLKFFTSRFRKV